MTQKFTAEEVRRAVVQMRVVNLGELQVEQMLIAYADTLSQPADSGRVGEDVVELAVRIHDREEAAQKGEPDPWAEEFPEPYRSERMTAMRLALEAALAAQGQGDSDGMCNEDHPERRCVCREEFGYRVCEPASPAGVPDGLQQVFAIPERCDWADESEHGRFADAQKFLAGFGLVIAAPSAPEGDGGEE